MAPDLCNNLNTVLSGSDIGSPRRNSATKPYLVLKFGGTSVGKFIDNICSNIIPSTHVKTEGTTSRLMKAAESVLDNDKNSCRDIVQAILDDHLAAARKQIRNKDLYAKLEHELSEQSDRLKVFLEAAEVINEVSPRSKDIIIGTGEKLACEYVSYALQDQGIDACCLSLEKAIERQFDSVHLDQTFYDYLTQRFAEMVESCGDKVPVVTGYFGPVPGGLLYNIGRGYTDLTAALIAVGMHASELQIWKEVDGIFTADPRKVPSARLLNIITPEEASELTYYGSEVIHPFTMEQVIRASIPIRIKNVQNPSGAGTIIFPDVGSRPTSATASCPESPSALNSPRLLLENGYLLDLSRRHPTAVTIKDKIVVLNIHSNRKNVSHGFFARIFSILDKYGITVDLISTSEVHVSMAVSAAVLDRNLDPTIHELSALGVVDIIRDMAILSLVGKQMRNMVGIAGKMFHTLATAGVNIEMISQGASEINISCVIHESSSIDALKAIHEKLLTGVKTSLVNDPEAIKSMNSLEFRNRSISVLSIGSSAINTQNTLETNGNHPSNVSTYPLTSSS
ncbi:Aspartokinase [Mycoemilia scoparia]|uniref:aspartate kinase n=1 Tax=Mycoemilia scoparia TaxID=417184 RepID=A0A9W8DSM2_9FUNG|nr:Aspartokinase [Mycoemilia scoparia]